ncbi:hypothetical protein [Paenibacillus alba]|uniref:Uncharacterized protein n=1 Tax=Paenibacillus alba TaxID=1197127 RepID=A0ABU6GES4_9BACL|nr:hypothetical protein [Paenibacillus alba]MEC0232728.1 hypothetical protein [Paenibacillus alba]
MDRVYVVIDLYKGRDYIAGATTDLTFAQMLAASAGDGHNRFIEVYQDGVKIEEAGYR